MAKCPRCQNGVTNCRPCGGTGKVGMMQNTCSSCHGSGRIPCPNCGGSCDLDRPQSRSGGSDDLFDCFVATACYGDVTSAPVVTLRAYRDEVLARTACGRAFSRAYYRVGPYPAAFIRHRPRARALTRRMLSPVVAHAQRRLRLLRSGHGAQ
jgi:hypothetical protein